MLKVHLLQSLTFLHFSFQFMICDPLNEGFISPDFCDDKVLTGLESYLTIEARSVIHCTARCSLDINCLSVSFIKKDRTCFLNFGLLANDCGNGVTLAGSVYYKKKHAVKKCMNNGTLVNNDCVCYGGYVGTYCKRLMTDCSEGYREMYQDGSFKLYEVLPPGAPQSFNVMCRMDWGGRTMIFLHFNPTITMNRTWVEYRDGFADSDYDSWIGLEKLYWLSRSKSLDLIIELKDKLTGEYVKIVYDNFEIGDSSTNYKLLNAELNTARSDLTVVDCLSGLIGSAFSSYDMDNNQMPLLGCPSRFGGGWWYNGACALCNPTGNLHNPPGGTRFGVDSESFWVPLMWSPEGITLYFYK